MRVGRALKFIRVRKGISQSELANNIVSASFLSKLENEHSNISFDLALLLIDRLGVSISEFIELVKLLDEEHSTSSLVSIVDELNLRIKNKEDIEVIQQKLIQFDCSLSKIALNICKLTILDGKSKLLQNEIENLMFDWEYIGHVEVILINLYYSYSSEQFKKIIFDRFCHLHLSIPKTKEFFADHDQLLSIRQQMVV
ncbi:helix-turn-helix domain-containing protein [Enterococcus thailandicus]|uniref:HTH cro/C1-type domain-containing protein n=1 Tax=Enterococcus thailandicus TaxID=417368 RepID=A0A179ENQ9_ENTTH|nr:helix-turn-helix transcriptional regulator [Enterococcus thailandicus]MDA3965893.1 helix-turn-helix transcriptional regulator [Enterococcus thailandicus]MDT2750932.1 helix-turn-helix transcriptional regulator [Enterococcus thailandicus]MDT2775741.1 helix-turn-helix transcriptional regulator [Enterococcus thailandicus]MDT2794602.1 helix-turn-helix transcriptional regulator [Enterococcus thailandicus]MDT2845121.1 helix-turn-helix transcriptional regulator [Enterococcus thailandicus]